MREVGRGQNWQRLSLSDDCAAVTLGATVIHNNVGNRLGVPSSNEEGNRLPGVHVDARDCVIAETLQRR